MRYALLFFLVCATPAFAAERSLTLTDFDRIRVEGGIIVEVRSGSATSGRLIGSPAALDAASVEVLGRQLTIRRARAGENGSSGKTPPAALVRITVPELKSISVSGPAKVSVDRLRGLRVSASLEGPGALSITNIVADRMDLGSLGAGTLTLGGTVGNLTATLRGAGTLEASKLSVDDLKMTSESAGIATIAVKRAAAVTMTGTGTVTILGRPACTVRNIGSGTVSCGSDQPQR